MATYLYEKRLLKRSSMQMEDEVEQQEMARSTRENGRTRRKKRAAVAVDKQQQREIVSGPFSELATEMIEGVLQYCDFFQRGRLRRWVYQMAMANWTNDADFYARWGLRFRYSSLRASSIDWLIDQSIDWLLACSTDRLIARLVCWQSQYLNYVRFPWDYFVSFAWLIYSWMGWLFELFCLFFIIKIFWLQDRMNQLINQSINATTTWWWYWTFCRVSLLLFFLIFFAEFPDAGKPFCYVSSCVSTSSSMRPAWKAWVSWRCSGCCRPIRTIRAVLPAMMIGPPLTGLTTVNVETRNASPQKRPRRSKQRLTWSEHARYGSL